MYASAQALDFLAMTKNSSFPNRKLHCAHPGFPDGHQLAVGELIVFAAGCAIGYPEPVCRLRDVAAL